MASTTHPRLLDQSSHLSFRRIVQSAALAAGLTLTGLTGALAQDATPAADTACVAPAAPMAATGAVASPAATPADDAEMTGTAADEALSNAVITATNNFVNCFNAGDIEAAVNLMTPEYRLETFGIEDTATIVAGLSTVVLPPTTLISIDNVMTYDNGQVSADVQYMTGEYQYTHSRMFFVQEGDNFFLLNEAPLRSEADGDSAVKGYVIADDTSSLALSGGATTTAMDVLIFYGQNDSPSKHAVVLLRLPDGAAATPIAEMSQDVMSNAEYIGAVSLEPGARTEMVMIGLPPGDYVLVDTGVPGSAATVTITAAD